MRSLWTVPALVFLLALSLSFDVFMLSSIIVITPTTNNGTAVDSEGNPLGVYVYDPGEAGTTIDWNDAPLTMWEVEWWWDQQLAPPPPPDTSNPPIWDPCLEDLP